jgi:hypothetical protein
VVEREGGIIREPRGGGTKIAFSERCNVARVKSLLDVSKSNKRCLISK